VAYDGVRQHLHRQLPGGGIWELACAPVSSCARAGRWGMAFSGLGMLLLTQRMRRRTAGRLAALRAAGRRHKLRSPDSSELADIAGRILSPPNSQRDCKRSAQVAQRSGLPWEHHHPSAAPTVPASWPHLPSESRRCGWRRDGWCVRFGEVTPGVPRRKLTRPGASELVTPSGRPSRHTPPQRTHQFQSRLRKPADRFPN